MVPKVALRARGSNDAHGFDPGGPKTWKSPLKSWPIKSAAEMSPAILEIPDETRREGKNGASSSENRTEMSPPRVTPQPGTPGVIERSPDDRISMTTLLNQNADLMQTWEELFAELEKDGNVIDRPNRRIIKGAGGPRSEPEPVGVRRKLQPRLEIPKNFEVIADFPRMQKFDKAVAFGAEIIRYWNRVRNRLRNRQRRAKPNAPKEVVPPQGNPGAAGKCRNLIQNAQGKCQNQIRGKPIYKPSTDLADTSGGNAEALDTASTEVVPPPG